MVNCAEKQVVALADIETRLFGTPVGSHN